MNKILMLAGIASAVIAVWLLLGRGDAKKATAADPAGSATTPSGSATAPSATKSKPVDKVGRVSAEDRKRLAEQIARAKAKRSAPPATGESTSGTAPRPELAPDEDATLVRTTMKDAMREVIPFLAECYSAAGDKVPKEIKVVADITLSGDPDIGTIIDTNGLVDGDGKPLEPSFDLCLRDALVSLQMPPLSEGGEVKVTYPFLFAQSEPP